MREMKTADLIGRALDWAVAKIEGYRCFINHDAFGPGEHEVVYVNGETGDWHHNGNWRASTNWSQGGPLIEKHRISLSTSATHDGWHAVNHTGCYALPRPRVYADDRHPLIAAMRCLVAAKLGDTVQVPNELI